MSSATPKPLFDKRLIGTWKSDRRKTFQNWKPKPGSDPAKVKKIQRIFGKLIVRYTRSFIYSGFNEDELKKQRYEVIAKDNQCAVIRIFSIDGDQFSIDLFGVLTQIHFSGEDEYCILLNPGLTECFRRVK